MKMKKATLINSFVVLLGISLFIGCKETPPFIDFTKKVIGLIDTTYTTSNIPATVLKKIYIEDITGVRCNNCPKAAIKVHEISDANPNNVVALGVYPFALTNLMNPYPGFTVLNTLEADDIFANVYNSPSAIPTGGVNRKIFSGETVINVSYNKWAGFSDIIKAEESPVIISSEITKLDTINDKARVSVKVLFTKKYDESVNLSIFLTESKILSKQSMPDGSAKDDYEHNHALRKAITNYAGIPLKINVTTNGNYEPGRVFEKEFEVDLDSKLKIENCGFIILVNRFDANSKEVLQAAELDLQ
jgi:hypothetical protein